MIKYNPFQTNKSLERTTIKVKSFQVKYLKLFDFPKQTIKRKILIREM